MASGAGGRLERRHGRLPVVNGGPYQNCHHGLLPSFPGFRPYEDAHSHHMLTYGATVHFIVPELDARMTYAYLRYAADLLGWSRSPAAVPQWEAAPKEEIALRLATVIGPAEELFWRGLFQGQLADAVSPALT